jgi:hypothetical protein
MTVRKDKVGGIPITDNRPRMSELRSEPEKSSQAAMNLHDSRADFADAGFSRLLR